MKGTIMTNHMDLLNLAAKTIAERGRQYGPVEAAFDRITKLFKLTTGKDITIYEAAMLMHCVKLARISESPSLEDSYVDGINYLAFAAQFMSAEKRDEATAVEDRITDELAKKFAPKKSLRVDDFASPFIKSSDTEKPTDGTA
jgi:hypothetical protein